MDFSPRYTMKPNKNIKPTTSTTTTICGSNKILIPSTHTHPHTLSCLHNLAMPDKNDDDDSTLPFCKTHVKPCGTRKTSLYYANPNPSVPIVIAVNNAERNCSYDSYSGKSIWLKQV